MARRLALQGLCGVQMDLAGCGDSEAILPTRQLVGLVGRYRRSRCLAQTRNIRGSPLILWGLRLGGLLAAALCRRAPALPAIAAVGAGGERRAITLAQFLRLRG